MNHLSWKCPLVRYPFWMAHAMKVVVALLTFVAAYTVKIPNEIRSCAYHFFRELNRIHTLFDSRHLSTISGPHFIVKYDASNRENAWLVLETAEKAYCQLAEKYNNQSQGIPIIIYPTRSELNACFGWSAKESAMGAYWAGVIRVLAPEAWISGDEQLEDVFINCGPMVHELTHLFVDSLTRGNVPRWFTEGLAQYEEYRLTGFKSGKPCLFSECYPFQKLDRDFDRLSDQSLAYQQSFAAVRYINDLYGERAIMEILNLLAAGVNMEEALQGALGMDLKMFEQNWKNYAMSLPC